MRLFLEPAGQQIIDQPNYSDKVLQIMMINHKKHYSITTQRLFLRPYCRKYVKQYNSWFINDPELLYLTGSQILSLEQQFSNHQSWLQDPAKYTFLIFTKQGRMIGDVNLFFSEWVEPNQAQINIMIAVKEQRGKGYAAEILKYVEAFALLYYKKDEISAKIKEDNVASQKLFLKSGYVFYQHSNHFKEIEYRKKLGGLAQSCKMLLEGKVSEMSDVNELMGE